jgi:hypothetical protein
MTVDLSKAEEGDTVEFRCGGRAVIASIRGPIDDTAYPLRVRFDGLECEDEAYTESGCLNCTDDPQLLDIIAIHKKPFDWADVKPGMAFVFKDTKEPHYRYVGKSTLYDDKHVFECVQWASIMRFDCELPNLTRAPERDIEVK